jgi:uncharacterized iron-regulated protein
MKARVLFFSILFISLSAFKSDKPAYMLFNKEGKNAKYEKLLKAALDADIILFGELHNNPVAHWLQYELTRDLYDEKGTELVLGAEMFESDNQLLVDEYLQGQIRQKNFESEARLWGNYETDYKPLLEFAKKNQLNFIATNIPRRYASAVFMGGFEALEDFPVESKAYFPPLPIDYDPELPGYKAMLDMGGMAGHGSDNLPKAQAIKDATMAWHILKNRGQQELFIHYNGAYHSNNYEGIVWYLLKERPELNIVTISTVEQEEINELTEDNLEIADFIICVPSTMTKTH